MLKRFALAAALLFLAPGWAAAQAIDADHVAAIAQDADSFATLAKGSEKTGQAPRATDPEAKPLVDAVLDTSALNAATPITQDDLQPLENWLQAVTTVGLVYILAGTGVEDFSAMPGDDRTMAQVDKNTVTFAPEMGRYYDATVMLEGGLIDAVKDLVAHMSEDQLNQPNVSGSLQQVRGGVASTIKGDITTMPLDGLTDSWRRDRLPALHAIAPKAAAFLTDAQRSELREVALSTADQLSDPDVKKGLADFAGSISE